MVSTTGDAVRPDAGHDSAHDHEKDYLSADKSILSWLLTVDHKRIGLTYLAAIIGFFFVGGMFAILIRLELLYPAGKLLTDNQYNRVFTLHGAVMIFLFLIPSIPDLDVIGIETNNFFLVLSGLLYVTMSCTHVVSSC